MTKKRIKQIFTIFTIFVVIGLVAYLGHNFKQYMAAKEVLTEKKSELAAVQTEIAEIKQAIAKYENEKAEFEAYLFKEQDIPAFLDDISKKAKNTEVNVKDMKTKSFRAVRPRVPGGNQAQSRVQNNQRRTAQQQKKLEEEELRNRLTLAAMPINMKIEGEFEALLKFFNSMEDIEQLITISNVEIVSKKEYPQLSCKYTLKIYSLKTLSEIETR